MKYLSIYYNREFCTMRQANLAEILRQSEQKKHFVIEKASIDPIFLKQNENFINLKFNVAISIWFEEECSFKPMKAGGFLLHKPSGDFIFNKEEWSDLCRKANVWIWGEDIYCALLPPLGQHFIERLV